MERGALNNDAMAKLKDKREGFTYEIRVTRSEMKPFSIVSMLKNLVWEETLKCYDGESMILYMNTI